MSLENDQRMIRERSPSFASKVFLLFDICPAIWWAVLIQTQHLCNGYMIRNLSIKFQELRSSLYVLSQCQIAWENVLGSSLFWDRFSLSSHVSLNCYFFTHNGLIWSPRHQGASSSINSKLISLEEQEFWNTKSQHTLCDLHITLSSSLYTHTPSSRT
jgi:hypothetical protein